MLLAIGARIKKDRNDKRDLKGGKKKNNDACFMCLLKMVTLMPSSVWVVDFRSKA